jgi:enoyl-[acyl-carrier protein] reductase/trans-2-enoyl-CoA reductase (NAD+)
MREDVQSEVFRIFESSNTENIHETGDIRGYTKDFKNLFGFGFKTVDYHLEQNEMVEIEGLV